MRVALDTNRLSDLFRGDASLAEQLGICDEVWIPFVVLGEIKAGFCAGTRQGHNELLLSAFLRRETVRPLYAGRQTTEQYGRLFAQLKRAGTAIPDNDLWIAALALEHDLALISRDAYFDRIPQLQRA